MSAADSHIPDPILVSSISIVNPVQSKYIYRITWSLTWGFNLERKEKKGRFERKGFWINDKKDIEIYCKLSSDKRVRKFLRKGLMDSYLIVQFKNYEDVHQVIQSDVISEMEEL